MIAVEVENSIPTFLCLIANSVTQPSKQAMINRWKKEWEKANYKDTRRDTILSAIAEGYDSYAEIAGATRIPEPTVRKIVPKLVQIGRIHSRLINPPGRKEEYRFELAES